MAEDVTRMYVVSASRVLDVTCDVLEEENTSVQ